MQGVPTDAARNWRMDDLCPYVIQIHILPKQVFHACARYEAIIE